MNHPPESAFVMQSSLQHPFVMLSKSNQMVEHMNIPSEQEFDALCSFVCNTFMDKQVTHVGYTPVLVDCEGDMLGNGGLMTTMAFKLLDQNNLHGVVIDMTCESSVLIAKQIMECKYLQKIFWGAESDFTCLLHQYKPVPLYFELVNVVDAQLCLSESTIRRCGLKRALSSIHNATLPTMPEKDCIAWDEYYSKNKSVMQFPLMHDRMQYALDDMHRIEHVIQNIQLGDIDMDIHHGWYDATNITENVLKALKEDKYGQAWFYKEWKTYKRSRQNNHPLVQQLRRAVVLQRHCIDVQNQCHYLITNYLAPSYTRALEEAQENTKSFLNTYHVSIPEDLSFANTIHT